MEDALQQNYPITTNFVRKVDRVSNKLLLKFTLGFETKIRCIIHEGDDEDKCDDDNKFEDDEKSDDDNKCNDDDNKFDDDEKSDDDNKCDDDDNKSDDDDTFDDDNKCNDGNNKCDNDENNEGEIMDDTDGLTDVLNDFEEISKSLNDVDIDLSDQEFDDINGSTFIDRAKNFSADVEELFRGKGINNNLSDITGKSMSNDIGDIISRAFKGKGKAATKKIEIGDNAVNKKTLNEETSIFRDAEEVLNANLNDNLANELNFNDVSLNTTYLNEADSNLVEDFNNFILDHDNFDENLLDDADIKHNSKRTEEESLLREIIPNIVKSNTRGKGYKNTTIIKPVKNLSKLKEFNRRSEAKSYENRASDKKTEDSKAIGLADFKIKPELSNGFLTFTEDVKFRVIELSREEQMQELQKRREGELYLSAPFKCADCAKGFRTQGTYEGHMKVHSPSHGMFICAICRMRHKSAARRRRHEDTHRLKYCCVLCASVARSRERAEAHFLWHAGRRFQCPHCGEEFGAQASRLWHVRRRHGPLGAAGLRLHGTRKHPEGERGESEERGESFVSEEAQECRSAAAVKCMACELSFASTASCAAHYARAHAPAPALALTPAPALALTPAPALALTPAPALALTPAPALALTPALAPAPRRADKKVVCEQCGKKYHSAAALSYHQRSHTGERPFACPLCPKAFAYSYTLQAHIRTHTGEKPYRCAQCPRAFHNANNLARHKKTVHLGQRQYARCGVCLKWLSSPSAARLHAACVHRHQPWPRRKPPAP